MVIKHGFARRVFGVLARVLYRSDQALEVPVQVLLALFCRGVLVFSEVVLLILPTIVLLHHLYNRFSNLYIATFIFFNFI